MRSVGLLFFPLLVLASCPILALAQNTPENAAPAGTRPAAPADSAAPPDLTPDAKGNLSQEQMQRLFRIVANKDIENDKLLRNYTYVERDVNNKLDGKGQTKSTDIRTYDVLEIYGEQVQKLIEKDDKPLSQREADKEGEKLQKIIDKRKNESDDDRRKREEKEEKEREDERKFVLEIADAYNFHLVGTEPLNGRDAWMIDAEPRPGFEPHMKYANILPKFHGRVWIDKADLQLAKMDAECLDTVSFGLFLARFHKGTRFIYEQIRVNDEVWLPLHLTAKVDVRLALLKNFDVDLDQTFRDYKKFRTSAKIVGVGEVKQ
jgi:hypothetical protein